MQPTLEEQLEQVTQALVETFHPRQIILFGSRAWGQPGIHSDVDMLIVMESDERPAARAARVSRLLRPRPFPMDLLVRTPQEVQRRLEMGDHFMRRIIEEGRVLYDRDLS